MISFHPSYSPKGTTFTFHINGMKETKTTKKTKYDKFTFIHTSLKKKGFHPFMQPQKGCHRKLQGNGPDPGPTWPAEATAS